MPLPADRPSSSPEPVPNTHRDWAPLPLPIPFDEMFIPTPFVERLVYWFDRTIEERVWRLVGASARAGKTRATMYYSDVLHPIEQSNDGRTRRHALPVMIPRGVHFGAPKLREWVAAELGAVIAHRTQVSAKWIGDELADTGTKLLILGDANRMPSTDHLPVIQEIADLYETRAGHRLAVVLLSATERGTSLLRLAIDGGDSAEWAQIRGRFAGEEPFVLLPGMTVEDVRLVLESYHGELSATFPELQLVPWTDDIYEYLKRPALAPDGVGHVPMQSVSRFVESVLRRIVARGMTDIDPKGDLIQEVGRALIGVPQLDASGDVLYRDVDRRATQ